MEWGGMDGLNRPILGVPLKKLYNLIKFNYLP